MSSEMSARLKYARRSAGYRTAREAIEKFGWKASTYRAHENGQNQFRADEAKLYAAAYEVSAGWLLTGEKCGVTEAGTSAGGVGATGRPLQIPILGKVAAGVWRELDLDAMAAREYEASSFPQDSRFPVDAQFDVIVDDASLNRLVAKGESLRCLDFEKSGQEAADGDLVLVERLRDSLRELTVRRVHCCNPRLTLQWESDDPRWSGTVVFGAPDETPRLVAKVLFAFRAV